MRTLLFSLLALSFAAHSESFIVEMKRPLNASEFKKGFSVELFDQSKTDYFRRTYRIEARDAQEISKIFPVKLIESIHRAQMASLSPAKNSTFVRSDELFPFQWGLFNQGQTVSKAIGTTKLISSIGTPGTDIRWKDSIAKIEANLTKDPLVAVIDMGIDFDHPDLKGKIFKNTIECDANGNIADADEDRDHNGLKGDCMGWNFTARNMFEARRPIDDDGHGTHVSGIIAAQTNKIGVSGVSSRIKILPIKVTGKIDTSSDKKTIQPLTDRIAKGILYATNMGADVINLSLGWTRSMDTKYLNEAMNYALGHGVVIVAAAGNNNNNASILPCSAYDIICVGATTVDGSLANFSNYGGEVDVLAPGDEIVSTIPLNSVPLQMNLQGYDVRSGTSQATPFVSALAALIRGTSPNLNRDEVTRRIVDSADAARPGESMNGMVNMKAAFEMGDAPSVRPVFKQFSTALYDGNSLKFNFDLPIKNFGSLGKNIKIKVSSINPALTMDQTFNFEGLRPGEIVMNSLEGTVSDMKGHNRIQVSVTISVDGQKDKSYQHEFRLARDILKDKSLKTIKFAFIKTDLPVGVIQDTKVKNLINTVELLHSEPEVPEYYLPRVVKESTSMEIKIFRKSDDVFAELPSTIVMAGAVQLLNVTKLDLNFDGEDDYLIRAIGCDKDCSDPSKAVRYLQYSLWKKDLSPLFKDKSTWRFLPTLVNVDIKSQKFYRLETKDFGPVAVPMFLETAIIPNSQQVLKDAFSVPDRSVLRRIYYLNPEIDAHGVVNLATKTISTSSYLASIRKELGTEIDEDVQAIHLLAQSKSDLRLGKVQGLFSIGKGYEKKNIVLKIGDPAANLSNFSVTSNIWGFEHYDSQSLDGQGVKDSFVGLVSKSRLVMVQNDLNQTYSYNSSNSVEAPLSAIASFNGGGSDFTFFQTPSYLMLAENTGQETILRKLKINRFSFLPGTLFNDSFYPIQVKSGKKNLAALYVDETDIQNDIVSLTVFDGQDLKAPIGMSAYVPPICKAMNPARLSADQSTSLSLLCLENKQWVMKFKEFKD